jgi:hypothetical protein
MAVPFRFVGRSSSLTAWRVIFQEINQQNAQPSKKE